MLARGVLQVGLARLGMVLKFLVGVADWGVDHSKVQVGG